MLVSVSPLTSAQETPVIPWQTWMPAYEKFLNEPSGNLSKVLDQYHVFGNARKKYFKELKDKYVWNKDEEKIYLDDLAKRVPVVVALKLHDGKTALAIAICADEPVYTGLFLGDKNKMNYVGIVEDDAKYKMFKPIIVEGFPKIFVLIGNQTKSGTGIAAFNYDIYQIDSGKPVSISSMPIEGDSYGWNNFYNLEYKSEFVPIRNGLNERFLVKVKFKYIIDAFEFTNRGGCLTGDETEKDLNLFDDVLTFDYDLQNFPYGNKVEEAIFNRNCASATTEPPSSLFLENHFDKLKYLAKNGKKFQKCWLRELLKEKEVREMSDRHYREELLAILNGNN